MQLLKIAELGDPILRKKAEAADEDLSNLRQLIENMKYTVAEVNGVGLAAPQVFESKRMFVMASKPNPRYPSAPEMELQVIINPVINKMSDKQVKDWEGCLSIPGIRGLVPRAKSVEVEYTNEKGERVQKQFDDFIARIFQHEFDHIEGIMFLDRVESTKEIITEAEYHKLVQK